jgi:hypothetical protein
MMFEEDDVTHEQPSNPTSPISRSNKYEEEEEEESIVDPSFEKIPTFSCPPIKSLTIHVNKDSRVSKTNFKISTEFNNEKGIVLMTHTIISHILMM